MIPTWKLARAAALAYLFTGLAAAGAAAGDVEVHGLLDVGQSSRGAGLALNTNDGMFDAYDNFGLRLFAQGQASEHFQAFSQIMYNELKFYTVGAYGMYTPDAETDFHVEAGKIPWIVGTYDPRSYSNKNPLVSWPLMYQYQTALIWAGVPKTSDDLLDAAGTGPSGVVYGPPHGGYVPLGMPVIFSTWWDFGVAVTGSHRPLEYALGVTNGTPGSPSSVAPHNSGRGFQARVGLLPIAGVRVGVSAATGPYLADGTAASLPPGKQVTDYRSSLFMGDAELEYGHAELRGEGYQQTWQSPYLGDLKVHGGYVEGKYTLPAGFYAAARMEIMRFNDITDSDGSPYPWDWNRNRLEVGGGYRFARSVVGKLTYQMNRTEVNRDDSVNYRYDEVYAAQVSMSF